MTRRAAKVDTNQGEIASALTDAYMSVLYLSSVGEGVPDLLVGGSMPCPACQKKVRQNKLLEIKSEKGTLTKAQQQFHPTWTGQIQIVRTIEEALKAVGVIR